MTTHVHTVTPDDTLDRAAQTQQLRGQANDFRCSAQRRGVTAMEAPMVKAQTILVPYDFSEASEEALHVAQQFASKFDSRIVLAYIETRPVVASLELAPMMMMPATDGSDDSRRALDEIAAGSGNLEVIIRLGDPAVEIMAIIGELEPQLVCMGTHGRRGLARLVMGSVAETVVRGSRVPVLTVHAPLEKAG
jgi:nucleotide-binding universal stress UspA family protein